MHRCVIIIALGQQLGFGKVWEFGKPFVDGPLSMVCGGEGLIVQIEPAQPSRYHIGVCVLVGVAGC